MKIYRFILNKAFSRYVSFALPEATFKNKEVNIKDTLEVIEKDFIMPSLIRIMFKLINSGVKREY